MRKYHENGSPDPDVQAMQRAHRRLLLDEFVATLGLMVLLLGVWAMAQHADDVDEQKALALAKAERANLALPLKVRDAYERGMSDALEAVKDTPDGVRLAQACLAQGLRPVDGSQR